MSSLPLLMPASLQRNSLVSFACGPVPFGLRIRAAARSHLAPCSNPAQACLACRYSDRSPAEGGPSRASSAGQRLSFLACDRNSADVTTAGPEPMALVMRRCSEARPLTHRCLLVCDAGTLPAAVLGAGGAPVLVPGAPGTLALGLRRVAGAAALGREADIGPVIAAEIAMAARAAIGIPTDSSRFLRQRSLPAGLVRS